ncbi:uncharacterized protein LOC110874488 [Helianthus annuus]|uniref:uncharacterized protein LOC110874488 n=1 Tax=Helianthus annuus TaxID=4232 RepID=UPI000B909E67|nr:uncharacterized protein LOC110874488 [Helianthus annuus]
MLLKCSFSGNKDWWSWEADPGGTFSVQNIKKLIRSGRDVRRIHDMVWTGWVPIKVNIHAWRLHMDRLPTKKALIRRQVTVEDDSCVICQSVEESALHLFTECLLSCGVWHCGSSLRDGVDWTLFACSRSKI